eukprot:247986_1
MSINLLHHIDEMLDFVNNFDLNLQDNSSNELDEISTSFMDSDDESKESIQTKIMKNKNLKNIKIFYRRKHIDFILRLQGTEESYEYCQTEHLRMQVLYWALCGLDLCKSLHYITNTKTRNEILTFIDKCYIEEDGGFGGNINHDVHLLNTLSAIQILYLLNASYKLNDKKDAIIKFIS